MAKAHYLANTPLLFSQLKVLDIVHIQHLFNSFSFSVATLILCIGTCS